MSRVPLGTVLGAWPVSGTIFGAFLDVFLGVCFNVFLLFSPLILGPMFIVFLFFLMLTAKVGQHDFTAPGGEIVGSGDRGKLKKRKRKQWKEALKNNPKTVETTTKNDPNIEVFFGLPGGGPD